MNDFSEIANAYCRMLCESTESGTFKLYRGFNGKYADDETRDGGTEGNIWTTTDPEYAKVYAVCTDDEEKDAIPSIVEYTIDESKISIAHIFDLDRIFDREIEPEELIDGFDDLETEKILTNGFNCVTFEYDDSYIFLLLNREMIASKRILTKEEFDGIEVAY